MTATSDRSHKISKYCQSCTSSEQSSALIGDIPCTNSTNLGHRLMPPIGTSRSSMLGVLSLNFSARPLSAGGQIAISIVRRKFYPRLAVWLAPA